MRAKDSPALHMERVSTTHMNALRISHVKDQISPHRRTLTERDSTRKAREDLPTIRPNQPMASSPINDNFCVNMLKAGLLAGSKQTVTCAFSQEAPRRTIDIQMIRSLNVNCPVANLAHNAKGLSQKKDVNPIVVNCYHQRELKYVKDVSCVDQLSFVKSVTNVQAAALNLPVGARLQSFWKTWETLVGDPKELKIIKQGYILPFRTRLNLTRSPTVISCYANPHRSFYLLEALNQLMAKHIVELVQNQKSLGFFNQFFLVPKQPVETHTRLEQSEPVLQGTKIQNGDT